MVAQSVAFALARRGIHYGWLVVAIAFGFVLASSAAMGVVSVLVPAISSDLGWSLGEISGPMALRFVLFGLIAPFAGALMLRYGTRGVVGWSAMLLLVGLLLSMTMTQKWQLWTGIGVMLGIASGITALVLSATIATRWFTARRGLVLGILSGATATGQLAFLPLGAFLAETYGWRTALAPSFVAVAVIAVAFIILVRNDPSELRLAPYGEDVVRPPPEAPRGNAIATSFVILQEASSSPVFWVLSFSFFICGMTSFGLIQPHFVAMCADFGVPTMTAASMLAVIGVADLLGTVGSGWLSDRYDNRWLLIWYYALRGVALIWLPFSEFTIIGLSFFAVIYGLDFIATVPPTIKLSAQTFGREKAPIVFGWIFASHQLGAGLMAWGAGASRDVLSTFLPAVFVAGILCFAAALSFLALTGRNRPQPVRA